VLAPGARLALGGAESPGLARLLHALAQGPCGLCAGISEIGVRYQDSCSSLETFEN